MVRRYRAVRLGAPDAPLMMGHAVVVHVAASRLLRLSRRNVAVAPSPLAPVAPSRRIVPVAGAAEVVVAVVIAVPVPISTSVRTAEPVIAVAIAVMVAAVVAHVLRDAVIAVAVVVLGRGVSPGRSHSHAKRPHQGYP